MSAHDCSTMKNFGIIRFWGLLLFSIATVSAVLPVRLEVKVTLDSQSANVHLSPAHSSAYPYWVTYGSCHPSHSKREAHHTVSKVLYRDIERLVWVLPENIDSSGCLSAWSPKDELIGRSERLTINKYSKQWLKKRQLDHGTRLSRRASIPMTNASGIDAEGPWFDGVEVLKENEISAVNVKEAKAKSLYHFILNLLYLLLINLQGLQ